MTIAYHFTGDTLRDGRPVPAIGETLIHEGPIEWCESGLYASPTAWDALGYAPGALLHVVDCGMIEREDGDKFVCRKRTIIKSVDATFLLRRFAADQALSVAHMWDMPDAVREYLTDLGEEKRSAARDAAMSAARGAAWSAAWDASWDASRSAADAAARSAAWAASWDAARSASRAASRAASGAAAKDAARDAAMAEFNRRVELAFADNTN